MVSEEKLDEAIRRKTRLIKRLRKDAAMKTVCFTAAMVLTFTLVFGIASAPTNDMFPSVHKGDMIIFYRPGRMVNSDIVLYEAPDGGLQIGRVEATEGETVGRTESGLLTINGNIQPVQKRSGLFDETYVGEKDIYGEVKHGKFLILGDSRETASDSRVFGLVDRKAIRGKVFTIIRRRP